jgi:exopolysaccharide biosynthesis polyprenyl glycosylphosphotransferase
MLKQHARRIHHFLLATDIGASGLTFAALAYLPVMRDPLARSQTTVFAFEALGFLACLAWPLVLDRFGMYASHRYEDLLSVLRPLAAASAASVVMLSTVAFAIAAPVAPLFPLAFGLANFAVLATIRVASFGVVRAARRAGANYRNHLVIGSGPRARYVEQVIASHPEWGLRIVAFVDDSEPEGGPCVSSPERVRKFADVPALLRDEAIDEALIACPLSMLPDVAPVVWACATMGVPVTLLSDLFGNHLPAPRLRYFDAFSALSFAPVHHNEVELALKRMIDLVGAAAGILLAAPLLALAALAIRMDSPGPIFFRQVRCGLNGRRFHMLKLRTMCVDAETRKVELLHLNEMDGPVFKITKDPRVTRVGRWLRRWSIDEVPQLWNVFRGDMSLVGPRPPTPDEVVKYEPTERRRLSMRPGITCFWQVSGRNEVSFSEWMKLDLLYIDTWSLLSDLRLLLRTLPAVLRRRGAS